MSAETSTIHESQPKSIWPMFVGGLVLLGLFWGIVTLMRGWAPAEPDYEALRAEVRSKNLAELRQMNEEKLTQYGWVNKEKGIVQIPVQRAIELVVPALNSKKPAPAYPIVQTPAATPEAGAPTPPAGAEPATPAN